MVNLNVGYSRPNNALSTLTRELSAVYGKPARPYEYVTGYKSVSNVTGHNADSNGVVHGVDIFVGPGNLSEGDALTVVAFLQAEGLRGSLPGHPDRLYYIIYRDRIAGDFSGWEWVGSGYGHWDHIHVSTCDLFWGDPAPVPAGDYDSTAPWGISRGISVLGETITPIPIQEDDMSAEDVQSIRADIATVHETVIAARNEATNAKVNADKAVNGAWVAANEATNAKNLGIENRVRLTALQATVDQMAVEKGATPGATSAAIDQAVAGAVKAIAEQLSAAAEKVGN